MYLQYLNLSTSVLASWIRNYLSGSGLGTSDFDAQMSGIKYSKGDENLRLVYKKPFYEILSGCLPPYRSRKTKKGLAVQKRP
jgi:hypothetical protein